MTMEEAIKTAIEFETQVRDVYRGAMEDITDPVGKRIFRVLAGEEQNHLDYLQSKLSEWKRKSSFPSSLTMQAGFHRGDSALSARVIYALPIPCALPPTGRSRNSPAYLAPKDIRERMRINIIFQKCGLCLPSSMDIYSSCRSCSLSIASILFNL